MFFTVITLAFLFVASTMILPLQRWRDEDAETQPHPLQVLSEEDRQYCTDLIGRYEDGEWYGEETIYNLLEVLERYGGAPGKVNATWTEKQSALQVELDRPTQDEDTADEPVWVYRYGSTDYETYARGEHGVRRVNRAGNKFVEVRGELYFTPEDFCGKMRRADYWMDENGFKFDVHRGYCSLMDRVITCSSPPLCHYNDDNESTICIRLPLRPSRMISAWLDET